MGEERERAGSAIASMAGNAEALERYAYRLADRVAQAREERDEARNNLRIERKLIDSDRGVFAQRIAEARATIDVERRRGDELFKLAQEARQRVPKIGRVLVAFPGEATYREACIMHTEADDQAVDVYVDGESIGLVSSLASAGPEEAEE